MWQYYITHQKSSIKSALNLHQTYINVHSNCHQTHLAIWWEFDQDEVFDWNAMFDWCLNWVCSAFASCLITIWCKYDHVSPCGFHLLKLTWRHFVCWGFDVHLIQTRLMGIWYSFDVCLLAICVHLSCMSDVAVTACLLMVWCGFGWNCLILVWWFVCDVRIWLVFDEYLMNISSLCASHCLMWVWCRFDVGLMRCIKNRLLWKIDIYFFGKK